ncbi:MAG TPA: hypothetical protein VJR22_07500 [Candidatus Nitrosotalea sp.]|nr:hypothetical protein [Nitrososphaerota archaeon]HKU33673.1 hypothetical protein [Candidatus Nitrosotalea sp.]
MTSRKTIDEIFSMSERELLEYLKETDNVLQSTDSIQIKPFEHGIKALYYHKDSPKPFKTRVYLKNVENTDSME